MKMKPVERWAVVTDDLLFIHKSRDYAARSAAGRGGRCVRVLITEIPGPAKPTKEPKWTRRQQEIIAMLGDGWRLRRWSGAQLQLSLPNQRVTNDQKTWPQYPQVRTIQPLIDAGEVEVTK